MPFIQKSIIHLSLLAIFTTGVAQAAPSQGIRKLGHAIQMGAFAEVGNAERFAAKLQAKGIEAFYFRKDNGIYAVRFGDFATKEKARAVANKLVADRFIDSYYIAPPNQVVFAKPKEPVLQKPLPGDIGGTRATKPPVTVKEPTEGRFARTTTEQTNKSKSGRNERDMGAIAARTAERFVGIPYRWGGDTVVDGMDCSGISIPRTSREQFGAGDLIIKADLQDGDLVFFGASVDKINHVGIYVGNGKFVHAPRRGEDIKISTVDESYFEKRFVGARRYFQ